MVWGIERCTFRSIIVVSTMEKRQRYEASLSSMPLFAALSPEQRAIIADCLSLETFEVFLAALMLMQHKMLRVASHGARTCCVCLKAFAFAFSVQAPARAGAVIVSCCLAA